MATVFLPKKSFSDDDTASSTAHGASTGEPTARRKRRQRCELGTPHQRDQRPAKRSRHWTRQKRCSKRMLQTSALTSGRVEASLSPCRYANSSQSRMVCRSPCCLVTGPVSLISSSRRTAGDAGRNSPSPDVLRRNFDGSSVWRTQINEKESLKPETTRQYGIHLDSRLTVTTTRQQTHAEGHRRTQAEIRPLSGCSPRCVSQVARCMLPWMRRLSVK